jgi:hypothetical protein
MNPKVRVVMRLFDEQIVGKLSDALDVDVAFSSSTVAAPVVAAMALQGETNGDARVLSSVMIDGVCHVAAELTVRPNSTLVGKRVAELEGSYDAKLLSRPPNGDTISAGDRLIVHAPANRLASITAGR